MKISIPQPCHENWNEMLPAEKGRFCHSCQKSVTDFTKLSDEEILKILQKPNQCGRFSTNQLAEINRELKEKNQIRFPRIFRYSTLMIGLGLGGTLVAQEKEKVEIVDSKSEIPISNEVEKILLKGQVIDKDGYPSPDNFITIRGFSEISTITNENGFFELIVPKDYVYVARIEDPFGTIEDRMLYSNKFNLIECCEIDLTTGPVVYAKKRTFTGEVLYTLAWPFRKIGKLF
jgi:hypothetical protein